MAAASVAAVAPAPAPDPPPSRPALASRRGYSDSTTTTTTSVSPPDSLDGQEPAEPDPAELQNAPVAYASFSRPAGAPVQVFTGAGGQEPPGPDNADDDDDDEDDDQDDYGYDQDQYGYDPYGTEEPWPYVPPQAQGAVGPIPYPPEHGAALLADAMAAGWPLPEEMTAPDQWILGAPVVPGVKQLSLPCEMAAEASLALHVAQIAAAEEVLRSHKRRAHFSIPDVTVTADSDEGGETVAEVTVPPAKRRSMVFRQTAPDTASELSGPSSSLFHEWGAAPGAPPADQPADQLFAQWAEADHVSRSLFPQASPSLSDDHSHIDSGDGTAVEQNGTEARAPEGRRSASQDSTSTIPAPLAPLASAAQASVPPSPGARPQSTSSLAEVWGTPLGSPMGAPAPMLISAAIEPAPPPSKPVQQQDRSAQPQGETMSDDDPSFLPTLVSSPLSPTPPTGQAQYTEPHRGMARAPAEAAVDASAGKAQVKLPHDAAVRRPHDAAAVNGPPPRQSLSPRTSLEPATADADERQDPRSRHARPPPPPPSPPGEKKQRRATFHFFGLVGLRKKKDSTPAPPAAAAATPQSMVRPDDRTQSTPCHRPLSVPLPVLAESAPTPSIPSHTAQNGPAPSQHPVVRAPADLAVASQHPWAGTTAGAPTAGSRLSQSGIVPPEGAPRAPFATATSSSARYRSGSSAATGSGSGYGSGSGSGSVSGSWMANSHSSSATTHTGASDAMADGVLACPPVVAVAVGAGAPAPSPLATRAPVESGAEAEVLGAGADEKGEKGKRGRGMRLSTLTDRRVAWQAKQKAAKAEKSKIKAEAAMLKELRKVDRMVREHDAKQAKAGAHDTLGSPAPSTMPATQDTRDSKDSSGKPTTLKKLWRKRKSFHPNFMPGSSTAPASPSASARGTPRLSSPASTALAAPRPVSPTHHARPPSRASARSSVRRVPSASGKGAATFLVRRTSTRSTRSQSRRSRPGAGLTTARAPASRRLAGSPDLWDGTGGAEGWVEEGAETGTATTTANRDRPDPVLEANEAETDPAEPEADVERSGDSGTLRTVPSQQALSSQSSTTTMASDAQAQAQSQAQTQTQTQLQTAPARPTTTATSTSGPVKLDQKAQAPTLRPSGTYTTRRRTAAQKELDAFVFPRRTVA